MAGQAKEWYPRLNIYKDVLQVEDPEGLEQDWYAQLAELVSPNILKLRIVLKLLDKAEDGDEDAEMEAFLLAAEIGLSIEQIKAGIVPEQPQMPQGEGAVPLLPEGGRVGGIVPSSAQRVGELQSTVEEV